MTAETQETETERKQEKVSSHNRVFYCSQNKGSKKVFMASEFWWTECQKCKMQ